MSLNLEGLTPSQVERINKTQLTKSELKILTVAGVTDPSAALVQKKANMAESMRRANVIRDNFRIAGGKKPGVICVYGLGQRFPVSLRKDQWKTIKENIDRIVGFAG